MTRAPWILRQLLRWLAAPGEADALVDDLETEAGQIADSRGARAARRWIRRQSLSSIRPLARHRLRGLRRSLEGDSVMWTRGWTTDARHMLRRMRRAPGFTAVAVLSLALGIGATSAIYSLAYAIWLKPLPFRAADELVVLQQQHPASGAVATVVSGPDAVEYRAQATTFSGVAVFGYGAQVADIGGERVRIVAHMVTPNLFDVLGARAEIGRTFVPADAGQPVVVLSHETWVTRFGADPGILSRPLRTTDQAYTIVGVMPAGFRFPQILEGGAWIPTNFATWTDRSSRYLQLIARLAPGATVERASADVAAIASRLAASYPADDAGWTASVVPYDQRDGYRATFGSLLGIVGLFLIVGCANLAGLLIARNVDRRGELAVCASLGASRLRLARQMVVEAAMLSTGGAVLGLALASAASRALALGLPKSVAAGADVRLSVPVLMFAIGVSALTALLCGVLPAINARSVSASEALTGARRSGPRSQRLQTGLVMTQVAIAMILLVGAALMGTSFSRLLGRDRGFNPHGVFALNVTLPFEQQRYENAAVRAATLDDIVKGVSRLPGVIHAGATNGFPGSPLGVLGSVMLQSQNPASARDVQAILRSATPDYFATMGVRLAAGRPFSADDTAASPRVVIINERLAAAMWPTGAALGRPLMLPVSGDPAHTEPWTVVGVAADMHLGSRAPADIFVPVAQRPAYWVDLVMRTTGDPAALGPVVRRALREINPDLLIENSTSIDAIVSNSLGLERAQSLFVAVIAVLSAAVAGIGLYALLAFAVAQRTREFAIRLALGSAPAALARWILFRGLRLAAAGVVAGGLVTFALVRLLRTEVFGLAEAAPWSYAAAGVGLLAIAAIALWAPARRVLGTEPMTAMRGD